MNFSTTDQLSDNPDELPPARRRRARRLLAPLDADERATFMDKLAHRASPSLDFFLLSLISGCLLSLGLLLDTPAFLILGAALAPLMAPVVGVCLGTVAGSVRLFLRSLAGLLIGCLIVLPDRLGCWHLWACLAIRNPIPLPPACPDFLAQFPGAGDQLDPDGRFTGAFREYEHPSHQRLAQRCIGL